MCYTSNSEQLARVLSESLQFLLKIYHALHSLNTLDKCAEHFTNDFEINAYPTYALRMIMITP